MKKNTNKTQEYILDLTDFTVDGSDYAGSYGNFSKFFEDDLEAIRFQQEVMDYISEQVYTGKAKFYLHSHPIVSQPRFVYWLPPSGGGFLLALTYWLTRIAGSSLNTTASGRNFLPLAVVLRHRNGNDLILAFQFYK